MRSLRLHGEGHGGIGLDIADAVDAGDGGDDDDVIALEQRARRRMAHAVDLLVDRGFLLDIGVGARDIGFRLVVVVIGDEILDRVLREEAPELAIELGGKRLVGRQHQSRALGASMTLAMVKVLPEPVTPSSTWSRSSLVDARDEFVDGLRLVACGAKSETIFERPGRLRISPAAAGDTAMKSRRRREIRAQGLEPGARTGHVGARVRPLAQGVRRSESPESLRAASAGPPRNRLPVVNVP